MNPSLPIVLLLAGAGAAGATARVLLASWVESIRPGRASPSPALPLGTMAVNVVGAFLAGLLLGALPTAGLPPAEIVAALRTAMLAAPPSSSPLATPGLLPWVASVGFLGAFTTFSTWMLEGWDRLADAATRGVGIATLALAMLLGVGAALAGILLAQALFPVQLP